jgi:ABC-type transport system involved in cytochrome c biogenesis permease component
LLSRELNPVLLRELRARWRKWPTFAIVFGYAILLAVAIGWMTIEATASVETARRGGERTAQMGFKLFEKMSWVQVIGWMILSPVLAAPAIAGEREQGLLDSLYLSGLTPREILRGKMQAVLWFIGLMLLVPLPVIALCFQMGGVSPQEFLLVMALSSTTALTGAAIGLHNSARAPTTGSALRGVFFHIFLWFSSSVFCCCFGFTVSPIYALIVLLNDEFGWGSGTWVLFTVLCQIGLTAYLLNLAQKALLRPLPESLPDIPGAILPNTPSIQVPLHEAISVAVAPMQRAEAVKPEPYGLNYFFSRLQTGNPILQFELNRRLRIRSRVAADLYHGFMVLVIGIVVWLAMVIVLADNGQGSLREVWQATSTFWLTTGVIGAAVMGAMTFARDREQLMLEPLLLSPLTNAGLVAAKLGAIVIVCLCHSLLLFPLLVPCIRSLGDVSSQARGVSLFQAVPTITIITLAITCSALLGMVVSWFCRRTFVATSWALALVLLLAFWHTTLAPPMGRAAQDAFAIWHPYYAVLAFSGIGRHTNVQLLPGLVCIAIWIILTAGLFTVLVWAMRDRGRSRDRMGH